MLYIYTSTVMWSLPLPPPPHALHTPSSILSFPAPALLSSFPPFPPLAHPPGMGNLRF